MGPPGDLQVEVDETVRLAGEELLELDRNTLSMLGWQAHQNAQTETIFAQRPITYPEPLSQTG